MSLACLTLDPWLSGLVGKRTFRLSPSRNWVELMRREGAEERDGILDLMRGEVFIYCKVPTCDVDICRALCALGFYVVDNNVTFEKAVSSSSRRYVNSVRKARPDDRDKVALLASRNFCYTRFHLDPMIGGELADKIKRSWVESFFDGNRGDQMVVSEDDGYLKGFNLLFVKGGDLVIDLIAVDSGLRRRGVSTDMIGYAEESNPCAGRIVVGTQVSNIPSIRLYEKLGFRMFMSNYVFHFHGAGTVL